MDKVEDKKNTTPEQKPTSAAENFQIGDLILLKNNQFIAFNKPAAIPVQADPTGDKPLIELAEIYTKSTLHLVHRLDRPASGVVLFAKTKNGLAAINKQFQDRAVQKIYLAIVQNPLPQPEGTLVHFLRKNATTNLTSAFEKEVAHASRAELHYRTIGSSDRYHLLEIELLTGRHHQIRAQLAAVGSPIKGDVKYGSRRGNPDRSIHLHAWKLNFKHPVSQELIEIVAPTPPEDALWKFFMAEKTEQPS